MLRLNLSTRPFYNERAVTVAIAGVALLTAALAAFNVAQILSLNRRNSELAAQVSTTESRAAELRSEAATTRQAMNREDVTAVQEQAREANVLINRRVFSWTDLFNRFEETLPDDVRILAVAPQVDNQGRLLVAVTVVSRRQEERDRFIERLESTGAFSGVIPRTDNTQDDGTLRSIIQGYYTPTSRQPATDPTPPESDPNTSGGNESPRETPPGNATAGGPR